MKTMGGGHSPQRSSCVTRSYRADSCLFWASDPLHQLGKGLQSHFLVRETEPRRVRDLLKATQLVGDN